MDIFSPAYPDFLWIRARRGLLCGVKGFQVRGLGRGIFMTLSRASMDPLLGTTLKTGAGDKSWWLKCDNGGLM